MYKWGEPTLDDETQLEQQRVIRVQTSNKQVYKPQVYRPRKDRQEHFTAGQTDAACMQYIDRLSVQLQPVQRELCVHPLQEDGAFWEVVLYRSYRGMVQSAGIYHALSANRKMHADDP